MIQWNLNRFDAPKLALSNDETGQEPFKKIGMV
jgi:hypothetical protein